MSNLEQHYNSISKWYEIIDWGFERFRYRKLRPIVWSYAAGKTLDLGVGTGLNIAYYPPGIEVTGVDLSAGMLSKARRRASQLGVEMQILQMDATDLKFVYWRFKSSYLHHFMDNKRG